MSDNQNPNLNFDLLKLENQLCFSLYVCSKEIIKKYRPLLEPLELTYTGYITMLALWEKDNVTVKALGETLYLDSGTLTPLLKKLELQGYVSRKRNSQDERNVYISLTPKGIELKNSALNVPCELIQELGEENVAGENGRNILKTLSELMEILRSGE